ncbi:hypothetical protein GCM10010978_32650 [Compostibacillus humi]|uniref:7-cyano-7-deazaguanine synthase n=1 Tax=Compostibacillus humi TaxID=1245525 RepID=A0A8J2XAK6_9BACI|nr:hypothetical protein [Compostibacillus humi]GFZ91626.1 hypothetical protein GCM10010978_32650 [Compostibacillus humi]
MVKIKHIDDRTNAKNNQKPIINILWTGGWDSTYRIVELSRRVCVVQPIYVYGDNRLSEKYEINAMYKILKELRKKPSTKAEFLPIKFINKKDIPANQEITNAYNIIAKNTNLGSQHEWLARLAYSYPGLELGTEASPLSISNILKAINQYGKLIKDKSGEGYILDPVESSNEGILVLGNFKFPIIKKTGKDMKKDIQSWGYEDVMKNVWVCHTPLYGKPCGLCHPCELKIETGMSFLLTRSAVKRYRNSKKPFFRYLYKSELLLNKVIKRLFSKVFVKRMDIQ